MTLRAEFVVCGNVVVAAEPDGLVVEEAVGIAGGRVVAVGRREDVRAAARPGARVFDAGSAAVVPGLHDFHIHLVGLARSRVAVDLDAARDGGQALDLLARRAAETAPGSWTSGRGWSEAQLGSIEPGRIEDAVHGHPVFVTSHDGHSAWASAAARRLAGISGSTPDPAGGRLERDASGDPTGFLRETALDLVATVVPRLQGDALRDPMATTLGGLAQLGITGATEAGDYTDRNGIGADSALGDSYSSLIDLAELVDRRLRLTLGIPVDAIGAAADRGYRTGMSLKDRATMRFGWAKEYADGALGSGTAALFTPSSCRGGDTGILRVTAESLDEIFTAGRRAGIGLAVHAIGDRAASAVLDAVERAPQRLAATPNDRMEHVQLLRASDRARLVAGGVTASIQPIHAAADRDLVESCWQGRQADAYAWNSLAQAGVLLAAGSDAPVESVNPWLGMFAAVHRRLPGDTRGDWRPGQALTLAAALHAYTLAPALALGKADEGHLRIGARADLAVLSIDLDELLRADESLATVRSELTIVGGREISS